MIDQIRLLSWRAISKIPSLFTNLLLFFFLASFCGVLLFRFLPVPLTPLMVIRLAQSAARSEPFHFEKHWVPLSEINPHLEQAVIAGEDMRFFEHYGFDFTAIHKAQLFNQRQKKRQALRQGQMLRQGQYQNPQQKQMRLRGASTISQQVAKNVFLWPDRSWVRKIIEAYFTGLIEVLWPKTRIMEVYLNVVELGDGIYGAQAAANSYFKKSAKNLSSSEAALLSAVLPNPRVYSVLRPSNYVRLRQAVIQRRMKYVPKAAMKIAR
jgi:monofunctional biosynthetic peptidoglycan transglycosylase